MFTGHHNITIFGMTGSGKSVLCRNLQNYFQNIIIFDTVYDYTENDGIIFTNFHQFSQYLISTQHLEILPNKLIIRLNPDFSENGDELLNNYFKLIYFRKNLTVVLEEAQNFASVHKIPNYLRHIALTGRHQKINFITTTQRIAALNKYLLTQAHHIFSGYTDNFLEIKTLNEYGFNSELLEQVNQFEFIWKNGREYYHISNNMEFFDLN